MMDLIQFFTLGNIAFALFAIAILLSFILHRLDPGTRDKLGAGHGKRGQE